ncbi:MAG: glycosyltransferase, partial [Proteobacteria bacterium]|nr:glycosyltransferase [Pseudomonadota bacterium]
MYEINGLASGEWLMKGDTIFNRTVTMMIKVLERFAARLADRVVVVTDGLRNYLVSNFSVEADKISVIPNGVDTKLFYPVNDSGSLEDLRARLGIQMDEFAVLFSGNLASWQGIDTLLTSVPIVLKQVPRVKFLIVGDGILRQHLQATTRKMNLEKQVLFTGMVRHEQVPRYVNLADLCVSPKRY